MSEIICVDFDGVLKMHDVDQSDPTVMHGVPVPGAIDWLTRMVYGGKYTVAIYSSRSSSQDGIDAMKTWLRKYGMRQEEVDTMLFPDKKPKAFVSIDDRAICFRGTFPSLTELDNFRPWNQHLKKKELESE